MTSSRQALHLGLQCTIVRSCPRRAFWGHWGSTHSGRASPIRSAFGDFKMDSLENLRKSHAEWIRAALGGAGMGRDEIWTKSIAVGSEDFVIRPRKVSTHYPEN